VALRRVFAPSVEARLDAIEALDNVDEQWAALYGMVDEELHLYQLQQLARDLDWSGRQIDFSRSIAKEFVLDAMAEGKAVPKLLRRKPRQTLATIAPPPAVPEKRKRKALVKMDV